MHCVRAKRDSSRDDVTLSDVARTVVTEVAARRATWTVWHVHAEAQRQARRLCIPADELEGCRQPPRRARAHRGVRAAGQP